MKKLALALLLSAGLVNSSFAARSKVADLDATIDEVSAQMDDQEAKGALAWMKKHKAATIVLGTATLAGTFVAVDALYHYIKKEEKDATWNNMWTKIYVVDKVKGLFASKAEAKDAKEAKAPKAKDAKKAVKAKDAKAPKAAKADDKDAKKAAKKSDKAEAKGKLEWVKENKGKVIASGLGLVAAILVTYDLTRAEKASLIKQLYAKVFKKNADAAVVA